MKLGNFPRKQYLIDGLQFRLVAVSLLYFLAIILVFAGVLFVPLMIDLDSAVISSPVVQEAARKFLFLHTRLWPPVIILLALLVIHNVVVSHRIVGPLRRIRSELKKIGSGNLFVHVKFRKNDYLDKEAESVNEMVAALRGRLRGIELNQKKADKMLVDLRRAMIKGSADEVNTAIEGLSAVLARINESMAEFQMPRNMPRPQEPSLSEADTSDGREPVGTAVSKNC